MNSSSILYPVFAMVLLTIIVSLRLMIVNVQAAKKRLVPGNFFALYKGEAPDELTQARDHYKNLFELPVLFYLLSLILYAGNDFLFLDYVLAWSFVLSRYVHSFIRATSNWVPLRFRVFSLGGIILLFHWCYFAFRVIF